MCPWALRGPLSGMLQSDSDDRKRLSIWARAREVAGKIPEKRVVGAARVLSVLGADTRPRRVGSSPAGASMSRAALSSSLAVWRRETPRLGWMLTRAISFSFPFFNNRDLSIGRSDCYKPTYPGNRPSFLESHTYSTASSVDGPPPATEQLPGRGSGVTEEELIISARADQVRPVPSDLCKRAFSSRRPPTR